MTKFQQTGNSDGIERTPKNLSITITDDWDGPAFPTSGFSSFSVRSPNEDISEIEIRSANAETGSEFSEFENEEGAVVGPITLTDDRWAKIPVDVFDHNFLKFKGDAGGVLEITGKG